MPRRGVTLDQARGAVPPHVKRREFVQHGVTARGAGVRGFHPRGRPRSAPWLLVPMDDAQSDHLKAYGLAFRLLERGGRGGVVPELPGRRVPAARRWATSRDAALAGVAA